MNKNLIILLVSFLVATSSTYCQMRTDLDSTEEKCMDVFQKFHSYIGQSITGNTDITSDTSLKYILLNYLFIDRELDSTDISQLDSINISKDESKMLRREVMNYLRFFVENGDKTLLDNVGIMPLRLSSDKFIYSQMTKFQKANTFILYDKRNSKNIIAYLLFIPPIKTRISEPRIWSWNLGFKFGKFLYTSFIGEEGYEYIFP